MSAEISVTIEVGIDKEDASPKEDASAIEVTDLPEALLVTLAGNISLELEPVGAFPVPFTNPEVESIYQAQYVRISSLLAPLVLHSLLITSTCFSSPCSQPHQLLRSAD